MTTQTDRSIPEQLQDFSRRSATGEGAAYAISMERTYRYPIAEVWSAWTEPERLARWLGEPRGDLTLGGQVDLVMNPPEGELARLSIRRCEAPDLLEVGWCATWAEAEESSQVRLELTEIAPERTALVLVHERLDRASADGYGAGWEDFLVLLEAMLGRQATRAEPGYDRAGTEQVLSACWEQIVPA